MRTNRGVLFLVLLFGATLGAIPVAAFLNRWWFSVVFVASSAIIAAVVATRLRGANNEAPSPAEYAYGMLALAAFAGSGGLVGLFLYGLIVWGTNLLVLICRLLGWAFHPDPHSLAELVAMTVTLLMVLTSVLFSPIPQTLSANKATVSAYHDLLQQRKDLWWRIPLAVCSFMISGAGIYFDRRSLLHVLAQFLIITAGGEPMSRAMNWSPAAALGKEAANALKRLYEALGYQTILAPRTKEPNSDLNSLLQRLDLLASDENGTLAIELKTRAETSRPVSAAEASSLPLVAKALSRYLSDGESSPVTVKPVLVLVGRGQTSDLDHLASEENVRVLQIEEEVLQQVLRTEETASLRDLARRYLHIGPASDPFAAKNQLGTNP